MGAIPVQDLAAEIRGDVFDPVDVTRRQKVYPVDIVDSSRDLSDGPKRLYAQLFRIAVTTDRRKNPWLGFVYASEKFLAERLGKSESAIRRDSVALRKVGLVRVERPKHQGSNHYFFLWHSDFHRSEVSVAQAEDVLSQRSNVSVEHRSEVSVGNGTHRSEVSVGQRSDVSVAYKEEQIIRAKREEASLAPKGGFLEFQQAYPVQKREIALDRSCRAYVSVIAGIPGEHERLMEGLERYKNSVEWRRRLKDRPDGTLLPMMSRFIEERQHCDFPPQVDEAPDDYRPVEDYHPEHDLPVQFQPEEAIR